MYRGSRKHVLDWVEHPRFVSQLLGCLGPSFKATSRSVWAPAGFRYPDEARLEEWGPQVLPEIDWQILRDWWLLSPRRSNTPNWDLAFVAELEGQLGLILVEAKANVPEMKPDGKGPPSESDASKANHVKIGAAIDEARSALARIAPDIKISRDTHYQLSNRLAFTWKIASLGLPVALVYLGFTGDTGIQDVGEMFRDDAHWENVVTDHFRAVGADSLLDKRHQLGGAPFWVLSRSRPVLQVSEARRGWRSGHL